MNKRIAFGLLVVILALLSLFDPRFAIGALSMLLGAIAITVAEWFVEIWTRK